MPLATGSLVSGSLDFLLCLTCLAIAVWCARVGNDLLFAGFLWIAAAAFVGALNLGGLTWTNDTHRWLSAVATGPGMLLVGLGVWVAMLGPFRAGRWLAPALSIGGAGLIFYLWLAKSLRLGAVTTGMSLLVLVALPVLAVQAYLAARTGAAAAAAGAIVLLLVAGFGVNQLPLADDGPIRHVDVLHIVLIACYALTDWGPWRDAQAQLGLTRLWGPLESAFQNQPRGSNRMTNAEARERFQQYRDAAGPIDTALLDAVFDALEPITCENMFGAWKGGELKTGHKGSHALKALKWHGKTFNSRLDAKPLMCYDEQGKLFSSQAMKGEASLWMVEFRGKVSACMVYDAQPVFDHFRRVDDRTVMGIMDGKDQVFDNGKHFYFYLERE